MLTKKQIWRRTKIIQHNNRYKQQGQGQGQGKEQEEEEEKLKQLKQLKQGKQPIKKLKSILSSSNLAHYNNGNNCCNCCQNCRNNPINNPINNNSYNNNNNNSSSSSNNNNNNNNYNNNNSNNNSLQSCNCCNNCLYVKYNSNKIKKNVRFSATVHVLLIPSRYEILSHCINVYYVSDDYQLFKREAVQEIREIARNYNVPIKDAMKFLYQPNFELSPQSTPDFGRMISPSTSRELLSGIDHEQFIKTSRFLESELKFIIDVKTDVELQVGSPFHSSIQTRKISSKISDSTPLKHHAWFVQWKKNSNNLNTVNTN